MNSDLTDNDLIKMKKDENDPKLSYKNNKVLLLTIILAITCFFMLFLT